MFIFYDFETSSRELLGQIMSYAFIVTNTSLKQEAILEGKIRLNRTECPEVQAILVNKINVETLQQEGGDEYDAALKIAQFLAHYTQLGTPCYLVGYNSNAFDLTFLRSLLIRYGFNPYFGGQLKNLDVLHWTQYLAQANTADFPWVVQQSDTHRFYSFKLQDIAQSLGVLLDQQSHDAREDVELTIAVASALERRYGQRLCYFKPYDVPIAPLDRKLLVQKTRHFVSPGETPSYFVDTRFYPLVQSKEANLYIQLTEDQQDLAQKTESEKMALIRYINPNKHFFICREADMEDKQTFGSYIDAIENDTFFSSIKQQPRSYFELIKRDIDISYQLHELGFKRIDQLAYYRKQLMSDPALYTVLIHQLLTKKDDPKDLYLIQLFNRIYLNLPNHEPKNTYLKRYLVPRYITGKMRKDGMKSVFLAQKNELELQLDRVETDADLECLKALQAYYNAFETRLNQVLD